MGNNKGLIGEKKPFLQYLQEESAKFKKKKAIKMLLGF